MFTDALSAGMISNLFQALLNLRVSIEHNKKELADIDETKPLTFEIRGKKKMIMMK